MKKKNSLSICLKLAGLVKPLMGFMLLAITLGLLGHLCATFITILGGYAIISFLEFDISLSIGWILGLIGLCAVLRGGLHYGEQACNHFIAFKLLALIRDKVFVALRRLCPAKLDGKEKGNLIAIITSDIELLEVFYAHTISPAAIAVLMSALMSVFIGLYHPGLGFLALLSYSVIGMVVPSITLKISGKDGIHFRTKAGEMSSFILDSLRGLGEILQYQVGEKRLVEMGQKTQALSVDEEKMKLRAGKSSLITNAIILCFDAMMLFTAGGLHQIGLVDFEGVIIPLLALMSSFGPVIAMANLGSTLQNTFGAGNRILDLLDETPAMEEITGYPDVVFHGGKAENITFSYGSDTILTNVSMEVPENSIVGIMGNSGSGKSTLLKLFMRFWSEKTGNIYLSNTKLRHINTVNLRNMESLVTQDTHLFHDSIRQNLRIAKLNASNEEIEAACKKASIHEFIIHLPKGYDTLVGELGETFSGGERQRIGLARAFLQDAPFMLLDEPTSNLDSLNEAVILRSIHQERHDKTVILVSHRQSTLRIADTIYCLNQGRHS